MVKLIMNPKIGSHFFYWSRARIFYQTGILRVIKPKN